MPTLWKRFRNSALCAPAADTGSAIARSKCFSPGCIQPLLEVVTSVRRVAFGRYGATTKAAPGEGLAIAHCESWLSLGSSRAGQQCPSARAHRDGTVRSCWNRRAGICVRDVMAVECGRVARFLCVRLFRSHVALRGFLRRSPNDLRVPSTLRVSFERLSTPR